jgi:hypothetical protein
VKVPVVLTTVRFDIGDGGQLRVSVDGQPYADDRSLSRDDVRALLDEITTRLETAVRVEVREADGTTYSDIETPRELLEPASTKPEAAAAPVAAGAGFRPGEQVALAYVVARQEADADGNAAINLPPALLAASRDGLVLLGLTSLAVAPVEATA